MKSKNTNKVRLVAGLLYDILERVLQLVFILWFYIPVIYWEVNNILSPIDWIQSGINLHYIPTRNTRFEKQAL